MLAPGAMMSARDGTGLMAPDAPSNHDATATSSSQIDQSWDDLTNEDEYEVQRADDSGFTTNVSSVTKSEDSTSHSWTGLDSGTTYYFRVRGENIEGDGDWSTTVSETTDPEPTAPTAPSNNSASADGTTAIDQTWTDNSGDETRFEVQIALDAGFTTGLQVDHVGANDTTKKWTGLTEGTQYFTRVRAENAAGSSSWSNTDSATTDAIAPDGAPSNNSLSPDSSGQGDVRADQSWTDNSTNETGFELEIALDAGFTSGVQNTTVGANVTSYEWTGLTEGTEYFSRVRAINSGGESAWSNTDDATTQLAQPIITSATWNGDPCQSFSFWRITWDDNSAKEQNYEVLKDGAVFDTLPADSTQYDLSPSDLNGESWTIRAIHSSIPNSDPSNSVSENCS